MSRSQQQISRVAKLRWNRNKLQIFTDNRWVWADKNPDLLRLAKQQGKLVADGDGWRIVSPEEWGRLNNRPNNSRYLTTEPPSRNTSNIPKREKKSVHWTVPVGLTMLAMLIIWQGVSALASWWQTWQDDIHYGTPRTLQMDSVVGHNNDSTAKPSHFITINLHEQTQVIEFPAGDPAKALTYIGPHLDGANADLVVVFLSFRDVTKDGKPDMILTINGSKYVFINTGSKFRNLNPGEKTDPL